jgi:hypothetical protein
VSDYVTWATPIQKAECAIKAAGDLLEDRKVNLAVDRLMAAQIAIAEAIQFLLRQKK